MNSPSVDVATILAGISSLALTLADDLHIGIMPEESTEPCVALFDTGGLIDSSLDSDNYVVYRPTIQVRVRGARNGYTAAYSLIESIRDELHGYNHQTVGSTRYLSIMAQSDVVLLGFDDNRRPEFSVNFRIIRR